MSNEDEDGSGKKSKYTKQNKGIYILNHVIGPLINALLCLVFYPIIAAWVKRHENQERAHG